MMLMRQHLPAPRHQPRRPARLPRRAHRAGRLDGVDGPDLVGLRHRSQGRRRRHGSRSPSRPSTTATLTPAKPSVLDDRPRPGARPRSPSRPTEQLVDEGWSQLRRVRPTFGQAGRRPATTARETGAFAPASYKVTNVFDNGGERYPIARRPSSTCSRSATGPTTPSSRSPRSTRSRTEPGRAPATPRSTPPVSASTCTWCATSAHGANQRPCSRSARPPCSSCSAGCCTGAIGSPTAHAAEPTSERRLPGA